MYDDRSNWYSCESEHFVYKYFAGSEAEKDIDLIIKNKESAYENISKFLDVKVNQKINFYFVPDIKTANELKMMVDAAVPHLNFASLIYNEHPLCREKVSFGHEVSHLLAYYWDKQIYHLEILEEGLAVYLDQSGSNKHLDFLNVINYCLGKVPVDLTFDVEQKSKSVNYARAGSIVKFLIEAYGIKKFKQLYRASLIDRNGQFFMYKNKHLPSNHLKNLIVKIYEKDSIVVQQEWLDVLGLKI